MDNYTAKNISLPSPPLFFSQKYKKPPAILKNKVLILFLFLFPREKKSLYTYYTTEQLKINNILAVIINLFPASL